MKSFLRLFLILSLGSSSLWAAPKSTDKVGTESLSHDFLISKNLDIFNSLYKDFDLFYVDTVNPDKAIKYGIDAMLSTTDPYTTYFPESEMKDLKFMTTGSYAGVGAVISQDPVSKNIFISQIYEGMPAFKAGLRDGDIFVSVDGKETKGLSTSDVSSLLRGEPKTVSSVSVLRNGSSLSFKVVREQVVIDPISFYGLISPTVGYIKITSFTDLSYSHFLSAFNALKAKGMKNLVIDLRSNPGGLLSEAANILNMFLPQKSTLVYTKGKETKWNETYKANSAPVDLSIPIAVLVDRNSASASEIVSGTLQDLDRAVIIGERTYGKGLVQTTRDIPFGGSLKVTIAKYYIPSGRCIQAIDYAKRDENGRVTRIPDSLTHVFHTAAGRVVRDGCGISPDVAVDPAEASTIVCYLVANNIMFDFANTYVAKHATAPAVKDFVISDSLYAQFKNYAQSRQKDFPYKSNSLTLLASVRKEAKEEGYLDARTTSVLDSLQSCLTHTVSTDMDSDSVACKHFLLLELVRRYYYQKGVDEVSLRGDSALKQAYKLFDDPTAYHQMLSPVAQANSDKKK